MVKSTSLGRTTTYGGLLAVVEHSCLQASIDSMDDQPAKIVSEYFSRIRGGEISAVDLFHDDASLVGLGTTRRGKDSIRDFYRGVIERAGPSPSLVGSLLVDDCRVAAEIMIELAGGQCVHAIDLFVVEEGRIRSLSYFLCSAA